MHHHHHGKITILHIPQKSFFNSFIFFLQDFSFYYIFRIIFTKKILVLFLFLFLRLPNFIYILLYNQILFFSLLHFLYLTLLFFLSLPLFLKNNLFSCEMCVRVAVHVHHMFATVCGSQKTSEPLELQLNMVVSCHVGVRATKLRSSSKAVHAFNC